MDQGDKSKEAQVKISENAELKVNRKAYLGDSVYAQFEYRGMLKLTTENGFTTDPSNTVYLEPQVVRALLDFLTCHPLYKTLVSTSKE